MFSLNQIDDVLKNFAVIHKQINSYGIGDPLCIATNLLRLNYSSQIISGRETAPVYPLMWAAPQPAIVERGYIKYKLSIFISDIQLPDESNQIELLSDTAQIFMDLFAYLRDPSFVSLFTIDPNYSFSITPFTEEKQKDMTAGWFSDIEFKVKNMNDRCQIPMSPSSIIQNWQDGYTVTSLETGTQFRSGTAIPNNTLGDDGDYFLVTTTGDLYQKVVGVYVFVMTLQGSGGGTLVDYVSAQAINQYDAVVATGYKADVNNNAHLNKFIGLANASVAANIGDKVVSGGEVTNNAWNWNAGDIIFLSTNGTLTNTPNMSAAFVQRVGIAVSQHTIAIQIEESIKL